MQDDRLLVVDVLIFALKAPESWNCPVFGPKRKKGPENPAPRLIW